MTDKLNRNCLQTNYFQNSKGGIDVFQIAPLNVSWTLRGEGVRRALHLDVSVIVVWGILRRKQNSQFPFLSTEHKKIIVVQWKMMLKWEQMGVHCDLLVCHKKGSCKVNTKSPSRIWNVFVYSEFLPITFTTLFPYSLLNQRPVITAFQFFNNSVRRNLIGTLSTNNVEFREREPEARYLHTPLVATGYHVDVRGALCRGRRSRCFHVVEKRKKTKIILLAKSSPQEVH